MLAVCLGVGEGAAGRSWDAGSSAPKAGRRRNLGRLVSVPDGAKFKLFSLVSCRATHAADFFPHYLR